MTLFDRVNSLCKANNIQSAHSLEQLLGFGDGTIYRWKKGTAQSDKLSAVADFFGVSVDYLLGRKEYSMPDNEQEMIIYFRRLPEAGKEEILRYARYILSCQPIKKETVM